MATSGTPACGVGKSNQILLAVSEKHYITRVNRCALRHPYRNKTTGYKYDLQMKIRKIECGLDKFRFS